ncbi:hypothetical protein GF318_03415 [Candidatus Micrarchaeota archaeon]|nr:hypothetical protein [Candidatus Micrarchaeota archaeon]
MLKPKKMKKARIIVLKSAAEKLLKDLHLAGLVDIRKTRYEGLDQGRPLPSFDEISSLLLELRSVMTLISPYAPEAVERPAIIEGGRAIKEARELEIGGPLRELNKKANQLNEKLKNLESRAGTVQKLMHFSGVNFGRLDTKTVSLKVGEIPQVKIDPLHRKMDKAKAHCRLVSDPSSNITLVLYEEKSVGVVDNILAEAGFTEIVLPEGMSTPAETLERLKKEEKAAAEELEAARKEMAAIAAENYNRVAALLASLQVDAERAEIASRFSESSTLYVLEGWILAERFGKLDGIVRGYSGKAVLQDVPFGHGELPPTVLDNPKAAGPFEFLTESYSLPNYFELDPTLPYMIGLPILYGMIVGDFFYGIISILLGYFLMQKFRKSYTMYNVSRIWFYSGFVTLIFGVIYDEWGGFTHQMLLNWLGSWIGMKEVLSQPLYTGFLRMQNILTLVGMTAFVGMLHLGAGFALGAVNEWRHNRKHAIAKIAWIGVELGILLTLLPVIGLVAEPALLQAGLVLLGISVIALAATEGILGIIELPGLLGNILSYTRIAAIGIVGIVIAEFLLNQFLIPSPEQGLLAIALIPIFLVLHVANAFLAMFESLVQGGRLNIVEFRSKFLHGGGETFSPFALKKD